MAKNAVNTINPVMVPVRGMDNKTSVHLFLETVRCRTWPCKLTIFDKNGHALNAEVDADDGTQSALFKVSNGRMKEKVVLIDYANVAVVEMSAPSVAAMYVNMVIEE